jgi:hypothetical protein
VIAGLRRTWQYAAVGGRFVMALVIAATLGVPVTLWWSGHAQAALAVTILFAGIELGLGPVVRALSTRGGVMAIDEPPRITARQVDAYFDHGFDRELGWARKANTSKKDLGRFAYHIGPSGSRLNPGHDAQPVVVATYGDSYTFCREVEDADTWQRFLADGLDANVLNFGVGNYGLDQALLRFEREHRRQPAPVVVMGVVPNTIVRNLSVWKHYNEFGNLLALKPRFVVTGDRLDLVPNPVDSRDALLRLAERLPRIQEHDYFYRRRFLRDAVRRPLLVSVAVQWRSALLAPAKVLRRLAARRGGDAAGWAAVVAALDRGGVRQTARLYEEPEAVGLFERLTSEFAARVRASGSEPVLLMMPMKDDVLYMRRHGHFYAEALARLAGVLPVVDAAALFDDGAPLKTMFREWHYSPRGNRRVAELLLPTVRNLLTNAAPRPIS